MKHAGNPLDEFVYVGDLVKVTLRLLDHPENAELCKVSALLEDVGKFEES